MIAPRENQLIIEKSPSAMWTPKPWQWTCSEGTARDGRPRYCHGGTASTWPIAFANARAHADAAHGVRI